MVKGRRFNESNRRIGMLGRNPRALREEEEEIDIEAEALDTGDDAAEADLKDSIKSLVKSAIDENILTLDELAEDADEEDYEDEDYEDLDEEEEDGALEESRRRARAKRVAEARARLARAKRVQEARARVRAKNAPISGSRRISESRRPTSASEKAKLIERARRIARARRIVEARRRSQRSLRTGTR